MPLLLAFFARRIYCLAAVILVILGLSSFAASAGLSSSLRDSLKGAMGVDLRIDSFVLDKGEATVGDTLKATVRVSNQGKGAAPETLLTFWAAYGSPTSTANGYRLATVRLGTLQSQAVLTSVSTFPVPNLGRLGTYQIFALVESSKAEANTQNNAQAKTLQIISPSFSDTGSTPVSDSGSSSSPPASDPVASSDSSSPPASDTGSSSTSDSGSGSTSSSPEPTAPTSDSASSSPPPPVLSVSCDYYASPTGRGTGTTPESPFQIQNFWALAAPGKTLCLLNGIYQGANNMIDPRIDAPGLSGVSGKPITIRALNDGGALIDGQFARGPVSLFGNNWFVLEGFNAKNSSVSGLFLNNSNHNIIRRVVIWDQAFTKNYDLLKLDDSSHNLIEDVGIFGTGRKSLGPPFEGSTYNVFRRVWARWEGSTTIGPKMTGSISYCPAGNCLNNTWENLLLTWSAESMPETYTITNGDGTASTKGSVSGFFVEQSQSVQHPDWAGGACLNAKFLGSLFYVKQSDRYPYNRMSGFPSPTDTRPTCIFLEHVFAFIHPSHPNFANVRGFQGGGSATPPNSNFAKNLTSVAGLANNFTTGWNVDSTVVHGTSLAAVPNPWTTTGNGANLCKRWIKGVVTNEPLWPWPMNDRIKAATASAGRYSGPCLACTGGRAARTATDVTAEVESLLGPIPPHCRSSQ